MAVRPDPFHVKESDGAGMHSDFSKSQTPNPFRPAENKPRMTCQKLADRIQELQSDASPRDVARLCLLLTNFVEDFDQLDDEQFLCRSWREMGIRLQAATDQHAAMTEDLEKIADCDPLDFTADQVWVLIRAIKVQSQVLQMYVGAAGV